MAVEGWQEIWQTIEDTKQGIVRVDLRKRTRGPDRGEYWVVRGLMGKGRNRVPHFSGWGQTTPGMARAGALPHLGVKVGQQYRLILNRVDLGIKTMNRVDQRRCHRLLASFGRFA
jgi:hypothetical protein